MRENIKLLNLIEIFKAFGKCRNSLFNEHEIFVKDQTDFLQLLNTQKKTSKEREKTHKTDYECIKEA